ncbi:hypothetical protein PRIPAC_74044 [Pristionchus pacificus]|uniref:Ubiquitin-like domain-containing protein n=1 Tax=Pristionchus pacificus TaxID=54126 RepID=A0A8R1V4T5_PRIPA|nr:hypothetical protein PRIPAC_74044 [Pristionchus pacificus]
MNDAIADAIVKDVARQLAEYGDEAEHFKLRVAARTMEEVHFRMKFITRLGKMKQYYADRNKVSIDSFRLFYMGELISDDDTPVTLGMKDGDEVEAKTLEQIEQDEELKKEQKALEKNDPLHKEKQALEKMEYVKRYAMSRAATIRNEKRKAEKAEQRRKRMDRNNNNNNEDNYFSGNGNGRVPPLPSGHEHEEHVCCCHCAIHSYGDHEVGSPERSSHSPFSLNASTLKNAPTVKNAPTPNKQQDPDFSSDEEDAVCKILPDEYFWNSFHSLYSVHRS